MDQTVSPEAFLDVVRSTIDTVAAEQRAGVRSAAELIRGSLRSGGVLQAFGTGHSEAFAMELACRAGGLVPTNRIALRDVVLLGGDPQDTLADPLLERAPETGRRLFELTAAEPADVFLIASNSGANGSVVEFARQVKAHGHPLIAVTSMAHTTRVESRHPEGGRLFEIADVVLDNGAPYGDAVLPLPGGGAACGVSSITAALLAQMMIAEVIGAQLAEGEQPPVYLSANIPGGHENNLELEARYQGRLRRGA